MTVGERIKAIRKEKGLTQKQVAFGCGMADSAIRKYESGAIIPKVKTLQRIADALGVHILDLLGVGIELDAYDIQFSVSPNTSDNEELAHFLNTAGIRTLYNLLSDEQREKFLMESNLIPVLISPEDGKRPKEKSSPEAAVVEQIKSVYGEAVSDTFSMYVLLDVSDQGEIRGEIKQMLKQGKYLKQGEI